jgi:hypothetical protein
MLTPQEIRQQMDELHKGIVHDVNRDAIMLITPLVLQKHAAIVDLASQLSEISSAKLERLTRQLIYLTWALVGFTAALLILTFIIVKHG